jgi:hypothetical protein
MQFAVELKCTQAGKSLPFEGRWSSFPPSAGATKLHRQLHHALSGCGDEYQTAGRAPICASTPELGAIQRGGFKIRPSRFSYEDGPERPGFHALPWCLGGTRDNG